ncbi:uncharacterized protein B0J16DRAFT_398908 [Fusarium flagelliforme]|uniref:uncharacterized protein n=1 Tax=Fusarium flagelliforme TaxID=2675880 RepID=UPI001E8D8A2F|nr:uncharacterized protein B0J16DRAFT_398908 [Fusarium flagelliforme]KAH7185176.1 hypothetical protein B0J16DRAFT_398908 [Fusarium flagelliforme]
MKLGVINVGEADFNPLVHFDFSQCTVEFESITTNSGMWNWLPEDWDGARSMLLDIPINHALWKLNPAMGDKLWVGTGTISNVTPEPPIADFNVPFLPSSLWVSNGAPQEPIQLGCTSCNETFTTVGQQLHHCRSQHRTSNYAHISERSPNTALQHDVDRNYWEVVRGCSVCGKIFFRKWELTHHEESHSDEKPFHCDWPGCEWKFRREDGLDAHRLTHTGERPWACKREGCGKTFTQRGGLIIHERRHKGEKPHKCPNCIMTFVTKHQLDVHQRVHDGLKPHKCSIGSCTMAYTARTSFVRHLMNFHGKTKEEARLIK